VTSATSGNYPAGCHAGADADPVVSHEHKETGLFTRAEVAALPMSDGYRQSATWYARLTGRAGLPSAFRPNAVGGRFEL